MKEYDRVTIDTNNHYRWLDEPAESEQEYYQMQADETLAAIKEDETND